MFSILPSVLIFIAGVINFVPVVGIVSGTKVANLYGLHEIKPTVEILLRHRAVLFGVIGGFMIAATFRASWQTPAIIVGFISMLSFIALCRTVGEVALALNKILIADYIGCACLLFAAILKLINT